MIERKEINNKGSSRWQIGRKGGPRRGGSETAANYHLIPPVLASHYTLGFGELAHGHYTVNILLGLLLPSLRLLYGTRAA